MLNILFKWALMLLICARVLITLFLLICLFNKKREKKKFFYRHVFFRVTHLLRLGIVPVIAVEGIPPQLKQDTMRQRQREGGRGWRGRRRGKKDQHAEVEQVVRIVTRKRFHAVHMEVSRSPLVLYLSISFQFVDSSMF